jgi:hypothetical protein
MTAFVTRVSVCIQDLNVLFPRQSETESGSSWQWRGERVFAQVRETEKVTEVVSGMEGLRLREW